ncbi:MAG: helix-turn-helix domain-containing protein [Chloroflexota bacterium]
MDETTPPGSPQSLISIRRRWMLSLPADSRTFALAKAHKRLRHLQGWIAENDALQLTLRQAAEIACLEPHYFSEIFSRSVGKTFSEWQREYRICCAVTLIQSGCYPIHYIAEVVGYRNRRSLERAVKSGTGCTPAELQRIAGEMSSASGEIVEP